jgi:hypothetical protein
VPFSRLACKGHWYLIPVDLRNRLLREYSNNFGERSYFEARAACLRALGVPEDEISSRQRGGGLDEGAVRSVDEFVDELERDVLGVANMRVRLRPPRRTCRCAACG